MANVKNPKDYLFLDFDGRREPCFFLSSNGELLLANKALYDFVQHSERGGALKATDFWPGVKSINWESSEIIARLLRSGDAVSARVKVKELIDGVKFCRIISALSGREIHLNLQSQRIETLGMLAGGVAHDFNNILTGILGHVTYLKTILPPKGPHSESLDAIEDGARKASTITQQILNFSRVDTQEKPARTNLCELVTKTFTLLRGAISPRYSLTCTVPKEPVVVIVEEGKMAQVIVNLVMNAKDAINLDGHVKVSIDICKDATIISRVFKGHETPAKAYARLIVQDDGHGIPPDLLPKIFEPYFSTKKEKGTGLGLATVDTIVKLFGGMIEVESQEGKGTTISVYLALADATPAKEEPSSSKVSHSIPQGSEKVLVVDDEYPVRNVLKVSLEHLGYNVVAVSSGPEAIEIVKKDGNVFDLAILDMLMPHMPGEEVFIRLLELQPTLRVLIISGFTSQESIDFVLSRGGKGFVQKPFTIEELAKKIRDVLDD